MLVDNRLVDFSVVQAFGNAAQVSGAIIARKNIYK